MSKFNERGHELPDPTPVEVPIGFRRPLTLQEEIMRFVRREMSQIAEQQGFETFEESDDFDVDDDVMPYSRHELTPAQEERIMRRDASDLERPLKGDGDAGDDRVQRKGNAERRAEDDSVGTTVRGERSSPAGGEAAAGGRSGSSKETREGA